MAPFTTIPVNGQPTHRYGLGLARTETPCGVTWGNDGASLGYLSSAIFSEGGHRGLVSVFNGNTDPRADPAIIEQKLLPTAVKLIDQQACTLYDKPVPTQPYHPDPARPPANAVSAAGPDA
jgi:hypothetical protein